MLCLSFNSHDFRTFTAILSGVTLKRHSADTQPSCVVGAASTSNCSSVSTSFRRVAKLVKTFLKFSHLAETFVFEFRIQTVEQKSLLNDSLSTAPFYRRSIQSNRRPATILIISLLSMKSILGLVLVMLNSGILE